MELPARVKTHKTEKRLRHWRSLCSKKPTVGFFVARNLRFSTAKQAKIAVFSRKAKTLGVSTKCIFAFDSPPSFRMRLLFVGTAPVLRCGRPVNPFALAKIVCAAPTIEGLKAFAKKKILNLFRFFLTFA